MHFTPMMLDHVIAYWFRCQNRALTVAEFPATEVECILQAKYTSPSRSSHEQIKDGAVTGAGPFRFGYGEPWAD